MTSKTEADSKCKCGNAACKVREGRGLVAFCLMPTPARQPESPEAIRAAERRAAGALCTTPYRHQWEVARG